MKPAHKILIAAKLDKTYWGKKIIAAELRGRFTDSNIEQAGDWQTCACGKQDSRIPRSPGSPGSRYLEEEKCVPLDQQLYNDGTGFYDHIKLHQFARAAKSLIRIERRAAIVLAKVLKK